jgi:Protein of unknown function (DUF1091)
MSCFFQVLFFSLILQFAFAAFDVKFTSIQCESFDNLTVAANCTTSGRFFSLHSDWKKPQNKLTVNSSRKAVDTIKTIYSQGKLEVLLKVNGKVQRTIVSKMFDVCALASKQSKNSLFIRTALDVVNRASPGFVHKCPYIGLHTLKNITVPKEILLFLPNGDLTFNYSFYDDNGKQAIDVVVNFQLS